MAGAHTESKTELFLVCFLSITSLEEQFKKNNGGIQGVSKLDYIRAMVKLNVIYNSCLAETA